MLIFAIFSALSISLCVHANTEIRNFDAREDYVDEVGWLSLKFKEIDWSVLNSNVSERTFHSLPAALGTSMHEVCEEHSDNGHSRTLRRCENEIWIRLELDDAAWTSFTKFTLRVSWPAFYPTDFDMKIFTPSEILRLIGTETPESWTPKRSSTTRKMYARIRLVDTGVRNPSHSAAITAIDNEVPFNVKLEPLYLGVLPASVVPTLFAIILGSGLCLVVIVPKLLGAFELMGLMASRELEDDANSKKTL